MPTNSISLSGLTLSPEYINRASNIFFQQAFVNTNLADFHRIDQGITNNKYIGYLRPDLITGKALGACGVPQASAQATPYQVIWTPKATGGRTFICSNDLTAVTNRFIGSQAQANSEQMNEFDYLLQLMEEKVSVEIRNSIFIKSWMGDTAAAAAPSGRFSTGFDLGLINQNDGLLKQTLALPTSQKLPIPENIATTTAGQVLTPARALEIVNSLYGTYSPELLKGQEGKIIYVSRSIFEGLRQSAGNTANILTNGLNVQKDGQQNVSIYFWDAEVKVLSPQTQFVSANKSFTTSGQALLGDPHFAVITVKDNIPMGLGSVDSLDSLNIFWWAVENGYYIDWSVLYDAKIIDTNLIAAAYL